jgi:hypothetical protein
LNQILKRQTSRSHYGLKVPAVSITVYKYRNKIGKIVVKAVPYSVTYKEKGKSKAPENELEKDKKKLNK